MTRLSSVLALASVVVPFVTAWTARTQTSWDCCKPACAWTSNLQSASASGSLKVCSVNDTSIRNPGSVSSSCGDTVGNGYLCSDYSPQPVAEDLSYGFAVMNNMRDCCKCFELQWSEGPVAGKRMQVQMINKGGQTNDIIVVVPGGGVGPNLSGCDSQYGVQWGRQYGGVQSAADCEALPDNLKGGCYWRWNWARGDVNNWQAEVKNITCPSVLTAISGCSGTPRT